MPILWWEIFAFMTFFCSFLKFLRILLVFRLSGGRSRGGEGQIQLQSHKVKIFVYGWDDDCQG